MYEPSSLSRNLWGYLNLAVAGTNQAKEFLKVKRLNGCEAWRRNATHQIATQLDAVAFCRRSRHGRRRLGVATIQRV